MRLALICACLGASGLLAATVVLCGPEPVEPALLAPEACSRPSEDREHNLVEAPESHEPRIEPARLEIGPLAREEADARHDADTGTSVPLPQTAPESDVDGELTAGPKMEPAVRELLAQDERVRSQSLMFSTYRTVLERLGRPDQMWATPETTLHWVYELGEQRLDVIFYDGFVIQAL